MLDAGCAVNELTASDYGFDIHVLLPERYPETLESWPMSSRSALLQVKGGASFEHGVRLDVDMWRFYLRSPTPVYIAVVPRENDPWIELVDRLAGHLDVPAALISDGPQTALLAPPSGAETWHAQLFAEDARIQSAADGRRTRKGLLEWASGEAADEPDEAFLRTLAELAFARSGSYEGLAGTVRGYVTDPLPNYEEELDVHWEELNEGRDWRTHRAYPLADEWLAEQLSLSEFMLPGGARSPDAYALNALVDDLVDYGAVTLSDLVLLAHREHFAIAEHLRARGLDN
jgi:hypothetical protein